MLLSLVTKPFSFLRGKIVCLFTDSSLAAVLRIQTATLLSLCCKVQGKILIAAVKSGWMLKMLVACI